MSYDSYSTLWHLTEQGWVEGKSTYDNDPDVRPVGVVLTYRRSVEQSSAYSDEDVSWAEVWRSPTVAAEKFEQLLKEYGKRPGGEGIKVPPRAKKPRPSWDS